MQVLFPQAQGFPLRPLSEVLIPKYRPWPRRTGAAHILVVFGGAHASSLHAALLPNTLQVEDIVVDVAKVETEIFLNHVVFLVEGWLRVQCPLSDSETVEGNESKTAVAAFMRRDWMHPNPAAFLDCTMCSARIMMADDG